MGNCYKDAGCCVDFGSQGRLPGEEHLSQLGKEESLGKNDNLVRAFQCELILKDHTF